MVNLEKIETMLSKVGQLPLAAVTTWYPKNSIAEIKEAIEASEKVTLDGNKVVFVK